MSIRSMFWASAALWAVSCGRPPVQPSAQEQPASMSWDEANSVLVVSGTWEEIGYWLGSSPTFSKSLAVGKRFWSEPMEKFYGAIEKTIPPDITAQMKGTAAGLSAAGGMSAEDAWKAVVGWNLFIDLINVPRGGCSAFAVRSKDGGVRLFHNTDGDQRMRGGTIMIFKPRGQYAFISYYGPQFVGVPLGANEKGLAVVYDVVKQKDPQYGLPVLMMNRMILAECATFEEATRKITDFLASGGRFGPAAANMLLVDFNRRKMARIEMASDSVKIVEAGDKGWIAATNHYLAMSERNAMTPETSVRRLKRLENLLSEAADDSLNGLLGFLADHNGQPAGGGGTLCVHTKEVMTVSSQVFDGDGNFTYSVGNPCESFKQGGWKVFNWLKAAQGASEKPKQYSGGR